MVMKKIIILLYASFLAFLIGTAMWLYLSLIKVSIHFLWHSMTENIFILLLIPIIGGIIIGVFQKYKGAYPASPNVAMKKYLIDRDYDNPLYIFIGAFTPLVSGGSVGPEASLLSFSYMFGAIAGDKVRNLEKKIGLNYEMKPYLEGSKIKDKIKINKWHGLKILTMNIVGMLSVCVLSVFDELEGVFTYFGELSIARSELLFLVPLLVVGFLVAMIYILFGKIADIITKPFKDRVILLSVLIGLFVSFSFLIEPFLLFSGEHEMKVVAEDYLIYSALFLVALAIYKLFITQICVRNTWRGGHGFPIIFASSCVALAIAMVFGINPLFCVAIVATTSIAIIYSPAISLIVMILILSPNIIILVALFGVYALMPIAKKNKIFGDHSGH